MKKRDTDSTIAAKFGVSVRTVGTWRKSGAPLHDDDALAQWIEGQARSKPEHEPASITEARRQKIIQETARVVHDLAVRRGEFLPKADVESAARAIGERCKAVLMRFPQEAALLVGSDPAVAEKRMRSLCDDAMAQLHDPAGYVTA